MAPVVWLAISQIYTREVFRLNIMQRIPELGMRILEEVGLRRHRSSLYGPTLPIRMRFLNGREELEEITKKVNNACDKIFKFFSWCLALAVAVTLWKSTHFGLFIIISFVMMAGLFAYTFIVAIHPAVYVADKASKIGANDKVVFAIFMILVIALTSIVPQVFVAGLGKLVRAQSCSMYHKNSPDIPSECRKFVRL